MNECFCFFFFFFSIRVAKDLSILLVFAVSQLLVQLVNSTTVFNALISYFLNFLTTAQYYLWLMVYSIRSLLELAYFSDDV